MMTEFLQGVVDGGNIMKLFTHPHISDVNRTVDFSQPPPKHDLQHNLFRVSLHSKFPKKRENVVCLFPNQNAVSLRILESRHYSNRDEFNKELNRRFSTSEEETEQFKNNRLLIIYGNHCFVCSKISGTVYILWAERVTRINASNTASIPHVNAPIIFNCDGLGSIKSMYLLKPRIENKFIHLCLFPKTQGNPMLMYDKRYNPFVCEKRPEKFVDRKITTISQEDAQALMLQNTQNVDEWLPFERVPFSHVQSTDEGVLEIEHNSTPWVESPRGIFQSDFTNSNLLIREDHHAPPQVMTHQREPDPFVNTSADEKDDDDDYGSPFSRGVEVEIDL